MVFKRCIVVLVILSGRIVDIVIIIVIFVVGFIIGAFVDGLVYDALRSDWRS